MSRVLYAEDDFTNRKLLEIKLSKAGIEILCVEDGLKAWETLESDTKGFDLLIVDQDMPRLSGMELCRKVREKGLNLSVICLTSDDSKEVEFLEAGFDQVIIKPLLDDSYLEVINRYLP